MVLSCRILVLGACFWMFQLVAVNAASTAGPGGLWTPPDHRTRDEWFATNGMPPDMYRQALLELDQLNRAKFGQNYQPPANTQGGNGSNTLDGCILLSLEQIRALKAAVEQENAAAAADAVHDRKKRQLTDFVSFPLRKWPLPIVYKFDGTHSSSEQQTTRNAFQHLADNTCLRFTEIGTNTNYSDNHIIFVRGFVGSGCYSYVGRVSFSPQLVNLESACMSVFGVPLHEVGHAIGLMHEQQRTDRDSYVQVLTDNIDPSKYVANFQKATTWNVVPYHYGSLMHYANGDFAYTRGQDTLQALQPLYQLNMGQRVEMSFDDIHAINIAYCNTTCSSSPAITCQRGGYQDPNNCARCKCPDGFGGDLCERLADSTSSSCGGQLDLTASHNQFDFKSPGYDSPGYYTSFDQCNWMITAPQGSRIRFQFVGKFKIVSNNCLDCTFHWAEVKYKTDLGREGARFCCNKLPNTAIYSESNSMLVSFKANFSTQATWRGFHAIVKIASNASSACDPATQFTCSGGDIVCVRVSDVCDFEDDCTDGSDEIGCPYPAVDMTKAIVLSINNQTSSQTYLVKLFGDPGNYATKLDSVASDLAINVKWYNYPLYDYFHSIAVNYASQLVYFSDGIADAIKYGALVYQNSSSITTLVSLPNTSQVNGLEYDWLTGNIYFIDNSFNYIAVVGTETRAAFWKPIITGLTSPRSLAVNPILRYLFWIDATGIWRSDMMGTNRITVLSAQSQYFVSPVKLAIDFTSQRLFWLDPGANLIGEATSSGSSWTYWTSSAFASFTSMTILSHFLYCGTNSTPSVIIYDVTVGHFDYSGTYGFDASASITDLTSFSDRQPPGPAPCSVNNGGCSQLCFAKTNTTRVCDCGIGFFLANDNVTCETTSHDRMAERASTELTVCVCGTGFNGVRCDTAVVVPTGSSTSVTKKTTPAKTTTSSSSSTALPTSTSTSTTTSTTTTPTPTSTSTTTTTTPTPTSTSTTTTTTPIPTSTSTRTTSTSTTETPSTSTAIRTATTTTTTATTTSTTTTTPTTTTRDPINECLSNPCQNGGTCVNGINRFTCTCVPEFVGVRCETGRGSDACVDPMWTEHDNWNSFFGSLYPSVATLEDCQQICIMNLDCYAVDYDYSGTELRCWLHLGVGYQQTGGPYTAVNQYSIMDRACFACYGAHWVTFPNTNSFYGFVQSDISTLVDCQRRCIADQSCVAVDFTPDDAPSSRCWLHRSSVSTEQTRGSYSGTWQYVIVDRCIDGSVTTTVAPVTRRQTPPRT